MAERGLRGGILGLLDLIEEHRDALAYDWRTRFHLPLSAIPDEMAWDEALSLLRVLRSDPSSQFAAAVEGWSHPLSREAAVLMDVWDLEYAKSGSKKRESYPRPFKTKGSRESERVGNTSGMDRDAVVAHLRRLGHNIN